MIFHRAGGFDNHASDYKYIKATPLAAAMGAEITGAHLSNVSDEEFAEIRHALFRHQMIYFRNQDISHAEQETFRKFVLSPKTPIPKVSKGIAMFSR